MIIRKMKRAEGARSNGLKARSITAQGNALGTAQGNALGAEGARSNGLKARSITAQGNALGAKL